MSSPLGYNPIAQSAPGLPRHDAPLPGHAPSVYTPPPSSDFTSGSGSFSSVGNTPYGELPAAALWGARVFAFLLFLGILPFWFVLYPLAAAAGFATATAFVAVVGALDAALDFSQRFTLASLAYLLPLWPMSRVEHRLAECYSLYRRIRQGLRLILAGGLVYYASRNAPDTALTSALLAMVVMHFLLRSQKARAVWDEFSRLLWLRKV